MSSVNQSSPSQDLEDHLQSSIPQVETELYNRAAALGLKYCEFDDIHPPSVVRTSVLPNGFQSFTATINLNVSAINGTEPNRIVEALEDWFDDFIVNWFSLRDDLSAGSSLPDLKRERTLNQWKPAPTWHVQIRRSFDLRIISSC